MREYSPIISLTCNSRGVYSLDPTLGCHSGTKENKKGCYNDCYAVKSAKHYGYDFSKTVLRSFENEAHKAKIRKEIDRIPLPFVRMGTMGDPSENWSHTLSICHVIREQIQLPLFDRLSKQVVIITKHWSNLTDEQLIELSKYNICINTSVSALDNPEVLANGLVQYERVKPYCKSILRVVSADFNRDNETGAALGLIQDGLFKQTGTLDTVLRVNKSNQWVKDGVIKIKQGKFLGKKQWISKFNKKTYLGHCSKCLEMCGVNI